MEINMTIYFEDGRIENHVFFSKEDVEFHVNLVYSENIDITISDKDKKIWIDWFDRFDFGW